MTDGQLVIAVLAAFVVYESLRWVPARAWLFERTPGGKWNGRQPWALFRRQGGGIAELRGLGAHVVAAAWPCVPHERGLCVWEDESGTARHVPWDQVKARADGAVLHLSSAHRVRCIHAASAASWAKLVHVWMKQTQPEREVSFREKAQMMLDVPTLTKAAEASHELTRRLSLQGRIILVWTFLVMPFTYWRHGDHWLTLAVAGGLFLQMFIQAFLLFRIVRRHGALRKDAVAHLLGVAFLPSASMRAADWVCSRLSPEAHPLAALQAWCPEGSAEFQEHAKRCWREARWPIGDFPSRPWDGPEVAALRAFLTAHEGPDADAFESPPPAQEGCARWCPRCLTQYSDAAGECSDCSGMTLLPLPREE